MWKWAKSLLEFNKKEAFSFRIIHQSKKSRARVGLITTKHGEFLTPSFVPVGTNAAAKCVTNSSMSNMYEKVEAKSLMFCNTYHLLVHPGTKVVAEAGGLHKFMNYPFPLITDSGGFQVFSLAYGSVHREVTGGGHLDPDSHGVVKKRRKFEGGSSVLKISENGVIFRSYRDGTKINLTPESSIQAQKDLGADIIIPFDELPPYHIDPEVLAKSVERTHRWQKRSLDEHLKDKKEQAIYGIVHGGLDKTLRKLSAEFVCNNEFDGVAIGGSLGKDRNDVFAITDYVTALLPAERPVHLLGIGDLESINNCIPCGIDTFDSAYPSRCARHGILFTWEGEVKIGRSIYKNVHDSFDKTCPCTLCTKHTVSYLHHLLKASEVTFAILATEHNFTFYMRYMKKKQEAILNNEI